jgi:glyoxylase-like metal-dependent hydrolase (beta-lactamase superfamily II)
MKTLRLTLGLLETNAYLAWCPETLQAVVIDPADEADRILSEIRKRNLSLTRILLTHAHGDHIGAVDELRKATGAPVAQHESERDFLTNPGENLSILFDAAFKTTPAEEYLDEGDKIVFGKETLKVLHTPGHTPGGLSFLGDGICFTGDLIFQEGVGRTDFPDASHDVLLKSIREKILVLPRMTILYPGHGPETTVGYEIDHNPFL